MQILPNGTNGERRTLDMITLMVPDGLAVPEVLPNMHEGPQDMVQLAVSVRAHRYKCPVRDCT